MRRSLFSTTIFVFGVALATLGVGDPPTPAEQRIRMPGTQPGQLVNEIAEATACASCHGEDDDAMPVQMWRGSMMAQAAKDPLFWAAMTVAAQDSIWLEGSAEGADICLRCHMPAGWLGGRSEPTNGSAMVDADFDGVTCEFCHRLIDPFFQETYDGDRECVSPGCDRDAYWDEDGDDAFLLSGIDATRDADEMVASHVEYIDGTSFYGVDHKPVSPGYTENSSGQYFVSDTDMIGEVPRRASFVDAAAPHSFLYSRQHKSRYFCSTCHDVSNPLLANRDHLGENPLPTEEESAFGYAHVERTFSEFMLSDFGLDGGAPGRGAFAPGVFVTSRSNNYVASCQDCHMPDTSGQACVFGSSIDRPSGSTDHPESGVPKHDLTGANVWMSQILASTQLSSPNYDVMNRSLLVTPGPATLTMDLAGGMAINPAALLAGADRALANLQNAAEIENVSVRESDGLVRFRVVNNTGHKLISGYPEGRRMWVNLQLYAGPTLVHEVNPYDTTEDTLRGLPQRPSGPNLGPNETYVDELVYEAKLSSSLTGEVFSQHFLLGTARTKDNRIPPQGFRIGEAAARMAEPVWAGSVATDYFTAAEYAGGYDDVALVVPSLVGSGVDRVEARLYYQTTSREYIEFLRNEINGTGTLTLTDPPPGGGSTSYIIQDLGNTYFDQLRAWGDTIWDLWDHNRDDPGSAPIEMVEAVAEMLFADGFETGDTSAW